MTEIKSPRSAELESILGEATPALDKGFVRVVDYMGNDAAVVQAARVSYGGGTTTVRGDTDLIRYLMRRKHTSPFEMCVLKLHIKAPICVARQWLRHRTAAVNEISARYSVLQDEFYLPSPENITAQSKDNKQGRAKDPLPEEVVNQARGLIREHAVYSYELYELLLNGENGLAREISRNVLPVSVYTEWYWRIDLHNLLHFLQLRIDPHAQYEIRVYAEIIADIVKKWVPATWGAFEEYRLNGASLSAKQIDWLRHKLSGEKIDRSGMGKGEYNDFCALLGLEGTD
jgi:thymidylate synthase (FAD)